MAPTPVPSARLVSIDPGLDRVAAVVWNASPWQPGNMTWLAAGAEKKLRCITTLDRHDTETSAPLPERLGSLARWAGQLMRDIAPAVVYVERPSIGGMYKRRTDAGQAGLVAGWGAEALLVTHWALGAIVGAIADAGVPVELVRPNSGGARGETKAQRQQRVRLLVDQMTYTLPWKDQDTIDAIAIGLAASWEYKPPRMVCT